MASEQEVKAVERINLRNVINQWNANRLDLFELSEPNEDLEFHGVMRFYFQDADQKVVTKCIRVSSTATVRDVVLTLIEKFRPDIRMLSMPDYTGYALYEIHENGEERKLGPEEKPLLVQLNWHKDDREGRFLFRRMEDKSRLPTLKVESLRFGRKLSKREKKDKKKKEKKEMDRDGIAEKLYTELPETSFTRSISNPEAVMRRRRQQKLEKKLQQFRQENGAGSSEAGGTLRIFGESLNRDVPYKTLLLSTTDTAAHVVKEILDKYGMDKEDPLHYCLVQVLLPPSGETSPLDHMLQQRSSSPPGSIGPIPAGIKEYILDDDDCPLAIERQHNRIKGTLSFHIRRRPADYQPRKRKKRPLTTRSSEHPGKGNFGERSPPSLLPWLVELRPEGTGEPFRHRLMLGMTEVGSAPSADQGLQLQGPGIHPRHCVFAHTEGVITVTPSHHEAEIYVDSARIYDTTILQHGSVVRFGRHQAFRFLILHVEPPHVGSRDNSYPPEYMERPRDDDDMLGGETYETAFDVLGSVEATSTHSHHSDEVLSTAPSQQKHSHSESGMDHRRGSDPILPAVLEFWEEHEGAFLEAVIGQLDWSAAQFKLAPAYTLYMACRYRASTHFRPEISPTERAHRLTALANEIGARVRNTVEAPNGQPGPLAFWLANASELLHFLRQDRHLSAYTLDAQDLLSEAVQRAFAFLVSAHRKELARALPSAFAPHHQGQAPQEAAVGEILSVLGGTMSLLRRCRVNAALTIQLFSWLFHHINVWLFNGLVMGTNYCCRAYGAMLKRRLAHLVAWAEKQGLELAADCHLARIIQAAHLLQTSKSTAEDVTSISSACFKLNSVQLRTLLERYQTTQDEPPVQRALIEGVVKVAENTADEQARNEGREVQLEEEADLQLPFLLPEDGYSCDIVRGVPAGLQEFLQPLALSGLCRLTLQPTSVGFWTIYMSDQDILRPPGGSCVEAAPSQSHQPVIMGNASRRESSSSPMPNSTQGGHNGNIVRPPSQNVQVATICLQKSNSGMGLSIVAARGVNQEKLGIYIKSVVKGGAADQDGRLQAGDQLLKVDGHSLIGITQEKAAELMTRTGQVVTLEVAKQGAIYHGLAALLCQPSPVMHRGSRRMSERDIPSRIVQEEGHMDHSQGPPGYHGHPRIQGSKSVPALNSEYGSEGGDPLPLPMSMEHHLHPAQHRGHSFSPAHFQQPLHQPPLQLQHPIQHQQNLGYSRTSSTASIPADASIDHSRYQDPPPSYAQPPKPGPRQDAVTAQQHMLIKQVAHVQEERHYQNISMYQQQHRTASPPQHQAPPPPQHPAYTTPIRHSGPTPPYNLPHQHLQHRCGAPLHSSQGSLGGESQHMPPGGGPPTSRPLSTLVSPREQEQYVNAMGGLAHHRVGPPSPQRGQQMPQRGSDGSMLHHSRGPHGGREWPTRIGSQPHLGDNAFHEDMPPHYRDGIEGHHQMSPHGSPNQRDVLRQEAKMEEMKEEVRRREEREQHAAMQMQHHPSSWGPNRSGAARYASPTRCSSNTNVSPPRPAPPQANPYGPLMVEHERSQVNYRYGPSGYPLSQQQETVLDDRHHPTPGTRSNGYREQFCDMALHGPTGKDSRTDPEQKVLSPSPWEREEKEIRRQQRLEEARQARDNEVHNLESLAERNLKQEERLRALRLEQEFERRAQEVVGAGEDDDDDEDLMERAEKRERIVKIQEDLERTRQMRLEWEQETVATQQTSKMQLEEQTVRLQQLKLEENSKKQELEAQRRAEERLIREAHRRQEEEQLHQYGTAMHQRGRVTFQDAHLPLSTATADPPPPLPSSPPPSEPQQRLDDLLANNGNVSTQRTKKVSFHDTPQEVEVSYDANGNEEEEGNSYTLQDIDEVLNTPHTSSYLIGSTPGVIGAQEVYRDPRQRIERQRMLEQPTRPPGPEKLTFREKMKMFARETGEDNTPKDKVKISRAQREIETNLNGVPTPNH
uniref:Putative actin filament-binding protein afadin n=1 Tax=Ornithodoros turicata TaxID=34597 RepID=A0A2R5LKM4_9ACAR